MWDDYWQKLTSNPISQDTGSIPPPDPNFDAKVTDICETYLSADERVSMGERTICLDEMTGIQALERLAPDLRMRPGKIQRREFEYIRHGTQTLIASFDVASGRVIQSTVGDTRTEADYLTHVQQTIATDPNAIKWHLIMDCLNIHQSESRFALCGTSRGIGH
jgi:putative transposase